MSAPTYPPEYPDDRRFVGEGCREYFMRQERERRLWVDLQARWRDKAKMHYLRRLGMW